MKTFIKFTLAIILLGTISTGCKKYVDGPAISLRTKKARITGDWKVEQAIFNGHDITAQFQTGALNNYVFSIKSDYTYTIKSDSLSDSGKWVFGEDKDDAYFTSSAPGAVEVPQHILRLKNTEIWFKNTASNGDVTEMHYKQ